MKLPSPISGSSAARILFGFVFCAIGVLLALLGFGLSTSVKGQQEKSGIQFGQSYHNDVSPPLRDLSARWHSPTTKEEDEREERHENLNPQLPLPFHIDVPDPVIDHGITLPVPNAIPITSLNFDGIAAATISSAGPPPDTDGAVGLTQYVQIVNQSYQVFNKTTGASVAGPTSISALWSGFGDVCQNSPKGDPIVLYDHLANRWLISQFAGSTGTPTDECIAISTSSDATGSYYRYAFHLGTRFFDYPKFGVWPDGYYMSMNVFTTGGVNFVGPQAFAFDRTNMLAGAGATFVTPGITGGSGEATFLPSDLDGTFLPPSGAGNPFVSFPASAIYKVRLFHADFVTPANSTFTLIGSPAAADFTQLCGGTRACVPQLPPQTSVDGRGDRLMFRLAYRKFVDGHEAVVGNYSVFANSVAAPRWFELRAVTTAPVVFQESTYAPDTTWRWMGSAAMDQSGDLAIGYSASDSTIHPQIRYAGRLVGDALNTLAQGETHLFDGTGSQDSTGNSRWGDYSAMTIDPVDDCTFWYTQEYYGTNGSSWKTRIGSFKFPTCVDRSCRIRALIVYADTAGTPTHLQSEIQAQPIVSSVDLFDAGAATPTLALLQQYDLVVPMSHSSFAGDGVALGNNLADYVDWGGVVVQLGYSQFASPGYSIEGRWTSGNYNPYTYSSGLGTTAFTLGAYNATHPLMAGVTTLNCDMNNIVTPAPGATQVAAASNGNSLVAFRPVSGGHTTVGITAYLGVSATKSGDWGRLIVNARRWLDTSCMPIVTISAIKHLANGHISLQGLATANTLYTIQASSVPNFASFSYLGIVTSDGTGVWQYDDSNAIGLTKGFYRLVYP